MKRIIGLVVVGGAIFAGKTLYYDNKASADIYKYCMEWEDSTQVMCESLQSQFDDNMFTVDDWNDETPKFYAALARAITE